jgi:hypothetical protein
MTGDEALRCLTALQAFIDDPRDAYYPIVSRDDVRAFLNGKTTQTEENDR